MICGYGCGKESKFPPRKGMTKWCCEEVPQKCPEVKKKNSESNKWENHPNYGKSGYWSGKKRGPMSEKTKRKIGRGNKGKRRSEESKRKIGDSSKGRSGYWKDKKLSKETINLMSKSHEGQTGYWKDKKRPEKTKRKMSEGHKFTIEYIKRKYKTFSKEEEMRYNPDEPEEKEIQVHCKYSKCKRSKEKGGWFILNIEQLKRRIYSLEKDDGNDGSYLYCSEKCKQNCCLYRLRSDPNTLSKYKKYHKNTWKRTHRTIKKFSNEIENIELRGKEHGYSLDHKFSIYDGFINNVDPKIIAHYKNLECIPELENLKKNRNSSITLEELLEDIKKK